MIRQTSNKNHFDLLYLAHLTGQGIKPLSRWEIELSRLQLELIQAQRLHVAFVERYLIDGSKTIETIFSRSTNLIDQYTSRFHKKLIDKSAPNQRFEGILFGYPACCVDHFIKHPYEPNSLSAADQKVLFHWACPNCSVTPLLLPHYRRIYRECCRQTNQRHFSMKMQKKYHKAVAIAASISLLALNTTNCSRDFFIKPQPFKPDDHLFTLPIEVDADQDFLEDRLESILSLDPGKADSDRNGVPDGPDLAQQLWLIYKTLPDLPRQDGPFIEHHLMRGLETCNVCNQTVNMGYAILINPLDNLTLEAPYIFLHHFFEHGSFSYDGTVHGEGRINAALLKIILTSDGRSHWLGDRYSHPEVLDLRAVAAQIDSLPRSEQADKVYAVDYQMKGIEMCHCCGDYFNMGYIKILNPLQKTSYDLPYIALHFLKCGSKKFNGDHNSGVVDIPSLKRMLE